MGILLYGIGFLCDLGAGFLSVSIDEYAGERLVADWGWPGVGQSLLCMVSTKNSHGGSARSAVASRMKAVDDLTTVAKRALVSSNI